MKFNIATGIIVSLLGGILVFSEVAQADTFDPGNIISDTVFTNDTSMSADTIQDFIRLKNVYCVAGEMPCLRDFTENGKSAGTILKEAASAYRINPQVLVVLIQKETGLITGTRPTSWLYKIAAGYGCPDTSACDTQYYGFTNQVHKAARMFRYIMDDNPNWYTPYEVGINYIQYNPNAACGGTNVNIQNRATQSLYNYTPYQPNQAALNAGFGTGDNCSAYGNRNFWLYFNTWFGSTQSSILIQSPQSPAVYLQSGGTRYGIPEWGVIDAYGLSGIKVTPVSDGYMNSLTNLGVLSTILANKSQPGPVYLADNGVRYGFASQQQCIDWGFPRCLDTSYARQLEPAIFDKLRDGGAMGVLMDNNNRYHAMINGQKNTFLSANALSQSRYNGAKATKITNAPNTRQPFANSIAENNSMIQFKGNPTFFAHSNGKYFALTWQSYIGLKSSKTPFFYDDFSKYTQEAPINSGTVGPFVQLSNSKAYLLTENQKINIATIKQHFPIQVGFDDIVGIFNNRTDDEIATNQSTFRTPTGTILRVENKTWRMFYTTEDYFAMGYSNPIAISSDVVHKMPQGDPLFAPGLGSLYQVDNPSDYKYSIFTTSTDGTVCQVYSMPQIGLYKMQTAGVYRVDHLLNSKINTLNTTVYDQNNNLHLTSNGPIHSVIQSDELISRWGIKNRMNICSLNTSILNRNPVNRNAPRFVRNEHTGVIYYGENGYKRPIYSWGAFLRMGGTSDNTLDVSMEFLVSSPDGVPITQ